MVSKAEGNESLMKRIAELDGTHTIDYGAEIGLGTKNYTLVTIDD
jgi:uncharacterized Fe-S center protein